jgi:predicted permease
LLRALLGALIPPADRRHVLAEVDTLYAARRARNGAGRAALWYLRALAGFAMRLTREGIAEAFGGLLTDQVQMARTLLRRKGFAAATILTLAVGLAGITTVYAIADWVLLRPVPGVTRPDELIVLRLGSTMGERPSWAVAHPDYLDFRVGVERLASLEASHAVEVNLAALDLPPMRVAGAVVTAGWFGTLGVDFAAGRGLSTEGPLELAGAGEVVLEHGLADALAGDAAAAVGRRVEINGSRFTVVGVTAEGFRGARFPGEERIWFAPAALMVADRSTSTDSFEDPSAQLWTQMVGRLHEGADAAAVAAVANGVLEQIRSGERPSMLGVTHFTMQATSRLGLDLGLQGVVGRTLLLLAAAGSFLLLLAVTNVANLGVMYAVSNSGSFAVQRALGIGRWRLLRELFVQYLLIGLLAGVGTVALLAAGARLLRGIRLDEFGGSLAGFEVRPRVMLVAGAVALIAGMLAGVAPAALVLRQRVLDNLRGGGDAPRGARRLRDVLVIAQVAVSTTLLVGAGLMARTIVKLQATDLGFDPGGVLSFAIDPQSQGYSADEAAALMLRMLEVIEADAGGSAGFVFPQPLWTSYLTSYLSPTGDPDDNKGVVAAHMQVSGAFLETLGARVLAGDVDLERWSRRSADSPATVIVSRAAAQALFPDQEPASLPGTIVWKPARRGEPAPVEIAAVIEDLKIRGAELEAPPIFVWPWAQGGIEAPLTGWVRARNGSTAELADRVRAALQEIAPSLPIFEVETAEHRLATISATQRVVAALAGAVSLIGVLLAAVGLYGVLGYAVTERRREIGIRSALGAEPGALRRVVLAGGLGRVLLGVAPGLLGALAASRWLGSLLFGVTPDDPSTYTLSVAVLLVTAVAASWLPARWASAVSPAEVLRVDG